MATVRSAPIAAAVVLYATDIDRLRMRVTSLVDRLRPRFICTDCEISVDKHGPIALLVFDFPLSIRMVPQMGLNLIRDAVRVWHERRGEEESHVAMTTA